MKLTIINKFGKLTGWNELTIRFLGRNIEGVTEIDYSDEQKMDNEYGAGAFPVGQSKGNYEAKGSITLYSEEIVSIQKALPPTVRIQDIPPFSIVCKYELNLMRTKDVLKNCTIKNIGKAVKQSDGKITHKCDLLISHIDWKSL